MMYVHSLTLAAVAGGAILAAGGCGRSSVAESADSSRSMAKDSVDKVSVGRPEHKTLTLNTTQPGRVEAFEETPLYPKVTGYVEEVLVDIGDTVRKGQKLIRLWIPEMQDELEQKEALVEQAEAEIRQAEAAVEATGAGISTAEARVSQAEAGIGRAEGQYERWKSEYERIKELVANGSVTAKLADEALHQFRAAEASRTEATANVESVKAELNEARANLTQSRADLVAAQARSRVATANLKQARTLLGYAEIIAPFDGIVTQRGVDTRHYVHPANGGKTPPLLVVARTDKVRVFVDIPELEAPLVDAGDPAVVRVQSLGNREFEATVTRSSWSLSSVNRSIQTEIDISNAEGVLRPGMYATVTVRLDERRDALALPITAIVQTGDNSTCCCVESGCIEVRPIVLGLRSGSDVEIISGLKGDEMIVLARSDSLVQGQPVEVIEARK